MYENDDEISYTGYYATHYDDYDDIEERVWTLRRVVMLMIALLMIVAFLASLMLPTLDALFGGSPQPPVNLPPPTAPPLI